jgi:hypothetical protein
MNAENSKSAEDGKGSAEQLDSKVIPVMREAVATVQLVLFGQLKEKLTGKYPDWNPGEFRRLVGCVVNDLFGTPARDKESLEFAREHIDVVEKELRAMADNVPDMLSFLTDALRMQTLCDHEEGVNSLPTLLRARAVGVLQEERAVPMPSTFMLAVRQLGSTHGLLKPMETQDPVAE